MQKNIITDKVLSLGAVKFSQKRPVKFIYNGIVNPIFTIRAGDFSLSTNKPHSMLSLKRFDTSTRLFLEGLDEHIPKVAYQNRKEWFSSDLFNLEEGDFQDNFRKNIGDYGLSIYLGIVDGNELPVNTFIKQMSMSSPHSELLRLSQKIEPPSPTKPLTEALQELAWGAQNGQIAILAQITGLWIKEESYGLSWKVLQILYRKMPRLPKGVRILGLNGIRDHNWTPPPDNEDDPVELPEDEISLNNESGFDDSNQTGTFDEPEQDQGKQTIAAESVESLKVESKPYNPLMEND